MSHYEIALHTLVGKSFTLLDGTIADIYLMFDREPMPFFIIKKRGTYKFHQIDAIELIDVLKAVKSNIIDP